MKAAAASAEKQPPNDYLRSSQSKAAKILSSSEKYALHEKAEDKVKTFLKPFFLRELISKEMYKQIMRKCVAKVYERSKQGHVKDEKIAQLVEAYVSRES